MDAMRRNSPFRNSNSPADVPANSLPERSRNQSVTTTWLGDAYDPRRAIDPRFVAVVQASVDHLYADFVAKVAAARQRTPAQIDAVAQGRVWTGAQALERGLVDRLGSYRDALASAARRGKLAGADSEGYRITYLEPEPGRLQRLLELFGGSVLAGLAERLSERLAERLDAALALPPVAQQMQLDLAWLADVAQRRQPFMPAVHCLCSAP